MSYLELWIYNHAVYSPTDAHLLKLWLNLH